LEGGIPDTDRNAALVLFRGAEVGQNMYATLSSRRGCQRANNRRGRKRDENEESPADKDRDKEKFSGCSVFDENNYRKEGSVI